MGDCLKSTTSKNIPQFHRFDYPAPSKIRLGISDFPMRLGFEFRGKTGLDLGSVNCVPSHIVNGSNSYPRIISENRTRLYKQKVVVLD